MLTHDLLRNRSLELSARERQLLEGAMTQTHTCAAGEIVVRQGVPVGISTLLVQGLMTRHVDALDGRRHLVAVHVPGDFVDLHAFALKRLDHDVGALTDITIAVAQHTALEEIVARHPQLGQRLWFLTLLDAAMHRQWVLRLASLNALQRVAHFLCEMNARLLAIGHSDGRRFALQMTQSDIGEVCGLTNVHVSRVMRQLRGLGLCDLRSSQVQIHDLQALARTGLFDPQYLYLNHQTALRAAGQTGEPHARSTPPHEAL